MSSSTSSVFEELAKVFMTPSHDIDISDVIREINKGDISNIIDQIKSSPLLDIIKTFDDKTSHNKPSTVPQTNGNTKTKQQVDGSPDEDMNATDKIPCAADVREMETCFMVYFDVPGISKEWATDITVGDNNSITLMARKAPYAVGSDSFHQKERVFGLYHKTVIIPDQFDISLASSKYEYGVLSVKLPKVTAKPNARTKIPVTFMN